ncbi:hypothetical protein QVZ43_15390 [Marinobacter sp. chi1]|uniref:Uncharacterized protein n=1 Tax=Marinobacter suaedae TaxID=3057675 RepID=A0ABT8W4D4_9GAMM|nr:hypothetical protein [Marinobacter sp. chi1]MDO3723107.1 hypothetical protein [Marinobacter sp. chi1]
MMNPARTRNPTMPHLDAREAFKLAIKILRAFKTNPTPIDAIAKLLGYTNARNGAAAPLIATLFSYGLLVSAGTGIAVVPKELFMMLKKTRKKAFRTTIVRTPPVFSALLNVCDKGLPHDAKLEAVLIRQGYSLKARTKCIENFKKSVKWAGLFETQQNKAAEVIHLHSTPTQRPPLEVDANGKMTVHLPTMTRAQKAVAMAIMRNFN